MTEKHGPRLDDELARESDSAVRGTPVEGHVEEFKEKLGDGEGLPADPALVRRELSRHLGRDFPARRDGLCESARRNGAPPRIVELLGALPADPEFATVHEVWSALEKTEAARRVLGDSNDPAREFEERAEGRSHPDR